MTTVWISTAIFGLFIVSLIAMKITSHTKKNRVQPEVGDIDLMAEMDDDILGVRNVSEEDEATSIVDESEPTVSQPAAVRVINLMAKKPHCFSGYDLLQTLLSAGLRFGNMRIFHRHQHANGKGPILFSLASISEPGTFDMQSIGEFSTPGLTLFMQLTDTSFDDERYQLMLDTAKQLADDLGGELCDRNRQPLREEEFA